ncbi:MAG TPA: hypothetical protein VF941_12840 [Clostridia bacterium]
MILRDNVMTLLVDACPSFKNKWEEHLQDIWDRTSETILYTDFSELARHLSSLVENNHFEEFPAIFEIVEQLVIEGDSFVQEAVVVGLIEDFQNNLLSKRYELSLIDRFLKTETKKYWVKVIQFWNGEIPYISKD